MDEFCQNGGFTNPPWMCHDVNEFASATVVANVDGTVLQQSPVLRMQQPPWQFDISFPSDAKIMRLEILRGPVAQGGRTKSGEWVVNQDAYDLVDIVEAGFVPPSYYAPQQHVLPASGHAHSMRDQN